MNPFDIIDKFYKPGERLHHIMVMHGRQVASKALKTAEKMNHLNPDLVFIEEAAMLHDIGIFMTRSPKIGCYGPYPYVCHGILGRTLLEKEGFPRHALVCERHVSVGITTADIQTQNLPLPLRDMTPVSVEEKIIAYADKFFSKNPPGADQEKSMLQVLASLEKYGPDKVERFKIWVMEFGDGDLLK
jgi:uncharacterized protein